MHAADDNGRSMLIAVVAALLASGVATSPADIALVEAAVKAELKDPDSAKFTWPNGFVHRQDPDDWVTCGTVNAKNGYGGYPGRVPVMASMKNGAVLGVVIADQNTDAFLAKECAALGLPVN